MDTSKIFFKGARVPLSIAVLTAAAAAATMTLPLTTAGERWFKFIHPSAGQMAIVADGIELGDRHIIAIGS